MFKFLGVICINDCRIHLNDMHTLSFYLVVLKETQHAKRVYQSLCVEDQTILEKMRYGWEKKRNMENASECFPHILPFALCAQWPLISLWFAYSSTCGKSQPRNADLWKMVVQNQAGWVYCYKWFKKWSVNDSFFLHTSIWYKTKVTRMALGTI